MENLIYGDLDKIQKKLLNQAERAMETAYNPYSNFSVGAAILSQKLEIITGSNVENAAYGSTICAERSALLRANARGIRLLEAIAIIAKGKDFETKEPTAPCGACRQMIYEASQISNTDLDLILSNTTKDRIILTSISELLPLAFGPNDLGINIERYRT